MHFILSLFQVSSTKHKSIFYSSTLLLLLQLLEQLNKQRYHNWYYYYNRQHYSSRMISYKFWSCLATKVFFKCRLSFIKFTLKITTFFAQNYRNNQQVKCFNTKYCRYALMMMMMIVISSSHILWLSQQYQQNPLRNNTFRYPATVSPCLSLSHHLPYHFFWHFSSYRNCSSTCHTRSNYSPLLQPKKGFIQRSHQLYSNPLHAFFTYIILLYSFFDKNSSYFTILIIDTSDDHNFYDIFSLFYQHHHQFLFHVTVFVVVVLHACLIIFL